MRFWVNDDPMWVDRYGVWVAVWDESQRRRTSVATQITFESIGEDDDPVYREPLFKLNGESATGLMNELWRIGIRPTEAHYNGEAFKAQGAHLADLRGYTDRLLEKVIGRGGE